MRQISTICLSVLILVIAVSIPSHAQLQIWTSASELSTIPMSGPAWDAVLRAANQNTSYPDVSNQDDSTNVNVLAAAIVYARTGEASYRDKVVAACQQLAAAGKPAGRTLAWARETGAYALAADLVGYRTTEWEQWLRNMAEVYVAEDGKTLRQMYFQRPNNWGSHAFGALCAIYRYLQDTVSLTRIRDYWAQGVNGPNPGFKFGDLSWQSDPLSPRLINPVGSIKNGFNLDGIIPDDMRRGGSFQIPPNFTGYPWEYMQGQVMAARILERAGMPIWSVGANALYRAAYALQVRLALLYSGWAATGDDEWMLPFLDRAYGTNWSTTGTHSRMWGAGKNVGWAYITLAK
jgi:hypothetical protein